MTGSHTRSASPLIVSVFASVLLASGCGGGETVRTVTVATTTSAATIAQPDPREELTAYVHKIGELRTRYTAVADRARQALDRVNTSGPDATWTRAARSLREARDEWDELAIDARGLEPPTEVRPAHNALAKSLQLNSQFADALQAALQSREVSRLLSAAEETNKLSTRVRELRSTWRIEVTAYARSLNVEPPSWVRTVGKA
jgi:hypothetical protein